ncbi:MAG: cupin domain-containing protein [Clostridiaceae bacterium]
MYNTYQCPYCINTPMCNSCNIDNGYRAYPNPYYFNAPMYNSYFARQFDNPYYPFTNEIDNNLRFDNSQPVEDTTPIELKDYGPQPYVVDINAATKQNNTFRTALWTGKHLQVTLMSLNVGEDIGLEIHPNVDQFLRVEDGQGIVRMGNNRNNLDFQAAVSDDFAIMIPAGKWHNIINTGNTPLKIYSIYAPPQHPSGTVHETKADAEASERKRRR